MADPLPPALATHLAIVVRQGRQVVYAVTRDRAMVVGGYWAAGRRTASWSRPWRPPGGARHDAA